MNQISIAQLIQDGYAEDPVGRRKFERPYLLFFAPWVITFITSMLLLFCELLHPITAAIIMATSLIMLGLGALTMYRACPRSRHTGKPLMKVRNTKPQSPILSEIIYVCPDSKTFFTRSFGEKTEPITSI